VGRAFFVISIIVPFFLTYVRLAEALKPATGDNDFSPGPVARLADVIEIILRYGMAFGGVVFLLMLAPQPFHRVVREMPRLAFVAGIMALFSGSLYGALLGVCDWITEPHDRRVAEKWESFHLETHPLHDPEMDR
jgi:hypothetical protein